MKRLLGAACVVTCLSLAARSDLAEVQGDLLKSSPPKFLLISEVDLEAKTLTGFSTLERQDPEPVVSGFYRTLNLADIKVTNARREAVDEADLPNLKSKLVVLSEGQTPLGTGYLALFRDDTVVITINDAK